jgi:hypothetical protein
MPEQMTPEELQAIENDQIETGFRNPKVECLVAEIRRCWAEIAKWKSAYVHIDREVRKQEDEIERLRGLAMDTLKGAEDTAAMPITEWAEQRRRELMGET